MVLMDQVVWSFFSFFLVVKGAHPALEGKSHSPAAKLSAFPAPLSSGNVPQRPVV